HDGQGLEPHDVFRASRQVHLAGGDRGGDAAVHGGVDEVHGALARREVAEDRVDVGVDESRHHRRPPAVDDGVGVLVETATDAGDDTVAQHQGVGVEKGAAQIAADQATDVAEEDL